MAEKKVKAAPKKEAKKTLKGSKKLGETKLMIHAPHQLGPGYCRLGARDLLSRPVVVCYAIALRRGQSPDEAAYPSPPRA